MSDTVSIINAAGETLRPLLAEHDLSSITLAVLPASYQVTARFMGTHGFYAADGQGQTAHDALLDALDQRDEARELAA